MLVIGIITSADLKWEIPEGLHDPLKLFFARALTIGYISDIIGDMEVRKQMSTLGEYIKERRLLKELSKRALAEKAGISPTEVHRIETGERTNPSVPVLNSLAEALGVPKDEVLRRAGYKSDDGDISLIERLFPDLKTEKQQEAAQKIIDGLARNSDLKDQDIDNLVRQVDMFLEYTRKKDKGTN